MVCLNKFFKGCLPQILLGPFMKTLPHICPPIFLCATVTLFQPRLFVLGGKELLSHEGTSQRDQAVMVAYGIALTSLLKHIPNCYPERDPRMVAFADDLTSAGRLLKLCSWWKDLLDIGPKYGYFPKPSKIILIIKPKYES